MVEFVYEKTTNYPNGVKTQERYGLKFDGNSNGNATHLLETQMPKERIEQGSNFSSSFKEEAGRTAAHEGIKALINLIAGGPIIN